jgi:protocatechuate 3,4-dioxygenase beta subunit
VEGATLQGTVQDYEGMPVASARVTAFPSSGNTARQIQGNTDASGFYTLPGLQVGSYSLNVQWEGSSNPKWLQREQISGIKCTAGSVLTRNFTLQRGSQIRGTVLDSQGAPLPGASVRLMLDLEYPFSDLYNTTTDSLGAYQINGLAPSQLYALSVSGPSSRPMEGMSVKRSLVIPESQSSVHDLQLVPGGMREGTVRNAQGLAVTPGMAIVLNAKIGMGQEYGSSQGRYKLTGVPEGDYLLILYPLQGNYSEALSYCHVTPGVTDSADVEIPASNVLEGKVYDAARQPVPNCKVSAQNRFNPLTTIPQFNKQAFTDSSGYYRIEGLSDGAWFAEAQPDAVDTTGTGNQAVMHLAAAPLSSGTTRVQDIALPAGGVKVFGTVRDQYGNRIPGSLVYFWRPGATAQQGSVQTDDWGNYALMLPPGTYSAHALYTSLLGTNLAVPPETNLTVAPDRILQHDFIMQSGGTLQGTCTDQLGRPEALAMVSVYESESPAPARIALTDNQGHYTVDGLHTGTYQVQVTKPGFATLLQTVNAVLGNDVSGFRSVVVAQTDISGNVRGRGGQGVEGAVVQALDASGSAVLQTATQAGGDYVLSPLSGGPFQVKAAGTGLKGMTQSGIYPGGRADFVLEPLIGKDEVVSYPNPCRGHALTFLYWAESDAKVLIRVYNQAGELAWDWEGEAAGPKFNRKVWDVSGVAPGVYLFKAKVRYQDGAETQYTTGKLTLIK